MSAERGSCWYWTEARHLDSEGRPILVVLRARDMDPDYRDYAELGMRGVQAASEENDRFDPRGRRDAIESRGRIMARRAVTR